MWNFLFDISKAFDRVWYETLIFKLRSYGISDSLLCLFNSFLSERFQRVVLNGQASEWRNVLAGVTQGSILGPLLFLIFNNDIPPNLECNVKIFADDTSLFSFVRDPHESSEKGGRINRRCHSVAILISTSPVYFNNLGVASCETHKHLGLLLDKRLVLDRHAEEITLRANKGIGLITRISRYLPRNSLTIYKVFIKTHLD